MRRARNAMMRIVDQGAAPSEPEVDLLGWMLALAENAAERIGDRALSIVRTTALAIADIVDQVVAQAAERAPRNFAIEFGRTRLKPAPWSSGLARIAGRIGVDVGAVALRTKLAQLGVGSDLFKLVEEELNREGLTMGALTKPSQLTTIADFVRKH